MVVDGLWFLWFKKRCGLVMIHPLPEQDLL